MKSIGDLNLRNHLKVGINGMPNAQQAIILKKSPGLKDSRHIKFVVELSILEH